LLRKLTPRLGTKYIHPPLLFAFRDLMGDGGEGRVISTSCVGVRATFSGEHSFLEWGSTEVKATEGLEKRRGVLRECKAKELEGQGTHDAMWYSATISKGRMGDVATCGRD